MTTKKKKPTESVIVDELHALSGLPKSAFADATKQIRERSESFIQTYANNLRIQQGPWDIAITFGEVIGERDDQAVIQETVKVFLTREVAKVLGALLRHQIESFEAVHGEIKIPSAEAILQRVPK